MKEDGITWRVFAIYLGIILLMLIGGGIKGQVSISVFNAEWNDANKVEWAFMLKEVETTIIIFKDNVEVARFQADLSFKMVATREEVQEEIDNQLMSDF